MSATRPSEELQRLAHKRATGELICAGAQVEIHVYLQAGRIAWATDSRHSFAFATHLQTIARIDPDTLRQVVEECRRERLPLGETLVEWGLATWDAVRTALAHQIALAVSQLGSIDVAATLFLERVFVAYNERLTFDVGEFVIAPPAPPAAPEVVPSDVAESLSAANEQRGLARRLRSSIDGLSWVEVLEHERLVDGDPGCPSLRVPLELVRATVLDTSDFVALRSARTSVIGVRMAQPRSLWCRLSADSTFGAVVSALWTVAGTSDNGLERTPTRVDTRTWSMGAASDQVHEVLVAFHQRAHELLGAIVMDAGARHPIAGLGWSSIEADRCMEIARRRTSVLVGDGLPLVDPGEHALGSIGFSFKTMVSGESRMWCFGAELERSESLWLFLDRRSSQGLGWAYLTALSRAIGRVRGGAA